jgi:uncharacterized membrane protein HdeD (DUF308 family)
VFESIMTFLRVGLGIVLALISTAFLIQGGLSRYAKFGTPPAPDWIVIFTGLVILAIGLLLIRRPPEIAFKLLRSKTR